MERRDGAPGVFIVLPLFSTLLRPRRNPPQSSRETVPGPLSAFDDGVDESGEFYSKRRFRKEPETNRGFLGRVSASLLTPLPSF